MTKSPLRPGRSTAVAAVVAFGLTAILGVTPVRAANGSGTSDGTYTIGSTNAQLICSEVTSYTYASTPDGNYQGTYEAFGQTYSGPLKAAFAAQRPAAPQDALLPPGVIGYENPAGLFLNDTCTIPDPDGWDWTGTVDHDPDHPAYTGGTLHCDFTGKYQREVGETEWILDGSCEVDGSAPSPTHEVHKGTLGTCVNTDSDNPPETCEETNTWVAT